MLCYLPRNVFTHSLGIAGPKLTARSSLGHILFQYDGIKRKRLKTIKVLLRRMSGDNLNIPMFFGFVGMFIMLMFWPGLGK